MVVVVWSGDTPTELSPVLVLALEASVGDQGAAELVQRLWSSQQSTRIW